MIAEATLVWAADTIVLDSVAGIHIDGSIILFNRDVNLMDVCRIFQPLYDVRVQIEILSSVGELPDCCLPRRIASSINPHRIRSRRIATSSSVP